MKTIEVKPSPVRTTEKERLPLNVALVLQEGFTSYTYRRTSIGTEVFPLGPGLTQYARNVCEAAFQKVTVVPSVEQRSGSEHCVLTPRVAAASFELPLSGLSKPEMVVIVEWTMKDRAAQKTLWLATVEGRAVEVTGTTFTYKKHERLRYQKLFDDLSRNTAAAFAGPVEIRRLVQPER